MEVVELDEVLVGLVVVVVVSVREVVGFKLSPKIISFPFGAHVPKFKLFVSAVNPFISQEGEIGFPLWSSSVLATEIDVPELKLAWDPQQKPKMLNSDCSHCWYNSRT